jgi:NADH-quinone oxidoreductase subunit C
VTDPAAILDRFAGVRWDEVTASYEVPPEQAVEVAQWLRDEAGLDYLSNVTGVDYPDGRRPMDPKPEEGDAPPGFLEVVYHLYSMHSKSAPVVLRQHARSRDDAEVASLTPVWRSAEFQEREVFDLFGVRFTGHPDLRRILMWRVFEDHPMRRDYVPPDEDRAPGEVAR